MPSRYTKTVPEKQAPPIAAKSKQAAPGEADAKSAQRRQRKANAGEEIVDKPLQPAALEAMSRMLDPVLVTEAEQPSQAESRAASFYNYIREHIETLQKHLREGEELFVYVHTGFEVLRVMNMAMPDWHLVVLTGLDVDDNPAPRRAPKSGHMWAAEKWP